MLARQSAVASWTARYGVRFHAGLEAADEDDLVPDVEGAGSMPQDGVGAVAGAVERGDNAATAHPDEGQAQQLGR